MKSAFHPSSFILHPWYLERAVRLELTFTGFAIQRLSHLATRAWRLMIFDWNVEERVESFLVIKSKI